MYQLSDNFKDHSEMSEKIHSGQFMISKYDEESDNEDVQKKVEKQQAYNFDGDALKKNFQFVERAQYEHKIEIDESLNTMFQYLSIAMSGKITNPKWNSFKGVKFQSKDKIRLNNIIWREYHMQFVKKLKPVVVQFASPLSDILQINGNVVLEGKYWKRRINIIVHEYKKWRAFYKNRIPYPMDNSKEAALFDSILVQRSRYQKLYTNAPPPNLNDIFMDLEDLNLPIDDISGVQHNSQIIQPKLTNLQPRMESSIDFFNEYFCSPSKLLKGQKPFSSETSLNVKPENTYFQNPVMNFSEEQCLTKVPLDVNYVLSSSKVNKRKLNGKPLDHYQPKPCHQETLKRSSSQALCKTPNLLSMLLQPVSSTSKQSISHQNCSCNDKLTSPQSQQPLLISTSKYTVCRGSADQKNTSAVNQYEYEHAKNIDLNLYKPQTLHYSDDNPSHIIEPSSFTHSSRIKHSIGANNAVQEYLDELSILLVSSKDHSKISKAALLHKASDHIKKLRNEKYKVQSEIVNLQSEIDSLQNRFSAFCSQLPATGVCMNNNKTLEGKKWFEDFVLRHSISNWKFYIFSMIFETMFSGYNNSVSTISMDTLAHSVVSWLEKECSLMKLRLIVINGMRTLSRRTSIVHNPVHLEEEVKTLIESSVRSKDAADGVKWSDLQPESKLIVRHSDYTKMPRYRYNTNSWPQMFTNTSSESPDV